MSAGSGVASPGDGDTLGNDAEEDVPPVLPASPVARIASGAVISSRPWRRGGRRLLPRHLSQCRSLAGLVLLHARGGLRDHRRAASSARPQSTARWAAAAEALSEHLAGNCAQSLGGTPKSTWRSSSRLHPNLLKVTSAQTMPLSSGLRSSKICPTQWKH